MPVLPTSTPSSAAPALGQDPKNIQSTIGVEGKRVWIYAWEIFGKYYKNRRAVALTFVSIYLIVPWISFHGLPLFQLDVIDRKMTLFGKFFWPQDLGIFLPLIISWVIGVFLVTALFGRIWCGWACPQTVFLQFIFEPIERFFEGKAKVRKKNDNGSWNKEWVFRKASKHVAFILFSLVIANSFLAYFLGINQVLHVISRPPFENQTAFLVMLAFTGVFYFVFSWFREQACIVVCPYAKFQSVLTDEKTLNILYDAKLGEKRAVPDRKIPESFNSSQCVDCKLCVNVCPTGIDIRDGLQLECIGCAKCVDACNTVMTSWGRIPLVGYNSIDRIEGKFHKLLRPRVYIYSSLILILMGLFIYLWTSRSLLTIDVTRKSTMPYFVMGDSISNIYTLRMRNKSTRNETYNIYPAYPTRDMAVSHSLTKPVSLKSGELISLSWNVWIPRSEFAKGKKDIQFIISQAGDKPSAIQFENIIKIHLLGPY